MNTNIVTHIALAFLGVRIGNVSPYAGRNHMILFRAACSLKILGVQDTIARHRPTTIEHFRAFLQVDSSILRLFQAFSKNVPC